MKIKPHTIIFLFVTTSMLFFIMAFLTSCGYRDPMMSADQQVKQLKYEQKQCLEFKKDFDDTNLQEPPTEKIKDRIEECKKIGAWK